MRPMPADPFAPSGVVTLTTDFGHKGPFVAVMKGVMCGHSRTLRVVDLTHETVPHWPAEAGFWLERAFAYFPPGTVHLAVVDPGVGTQRDILVLRRDGHIFVAPDNGLLGSLLDAAPEGSELRRLSEDGLSRAGIVAPSSTFHGRDIFAPVGAQLASGALTPEALGPVTDDYVPSLIDPATRSDRAIEGIVVTADGFGNLITNIDGDWLADWPAAEIQVGGRTMSLHRTYGNVTPGDWLALVNSFGVLEIARAEQSALKALGVGRGAPVRVVPGQS